MPTRLMVLLILGLLVSSVMSALPASTQAQDGTDATHCTNGIFAGMDGTETGQPYPTILTSKAFESAAAVVDPITNLPQIAFSLTDEGGDIFHAHSSTHIGQQLAIVLDGRVLTAPVIQAALSDQGVISGSFTAEEAHILALQIRSGSLALRLELVDSSFRGVASYGFTRLLFRVVLAEGMELSDDYANNRSKPIIDLESAVRSGYRCTK